MDGTLDLTKMMTGGFAVIFVSEIVDLMVANMVTETAGDLVGEMVMEIVSWAVTCR